MLSMFCYPEPFQKCNFAVTYIYYFKYFKKVEDIYLVSSTTEVKGSQIMENLQLVILQKL